MESPSSVELASQVGTDVGLGCKHQRRSANHRHQRLQQQEDQLEQEEEVLVHHSNSHQYLDQEVVSAPADVLSNNEDDFLDRLEEEEAPDDMTPDVSLLSHRRVSSPADCAVNKKSNKPMMEKKRRQRINRCLNELKTLVLEAMNKDPSQYSKLEKADILEMTVQHLQILHRQEHGTGRITGNGRIINGDDVSKYRAGFTQCAAAVTKYLATMNDVPHDLHTKVFTHLNSLSTSTATSVNTNTSCVQNSVNVMPNPAPIILVVNNATATPAPISQIATQPIAFQDNAGNSLGAQPNFALITTPRTQSIAAPIQQQPLNNGLQILPTRLNNGDLALVLPATAALPQTIQSKDMRSSPSATLQASAPVLTAILTSDRNQISSSSTVVQPPALSTSSDDSALGPETLDISDSDMSSGICTPMSSLSSASSPLPGEEAGRVSPKKASTSRSASSPKHQMWNSSCFREELISTPCSSQNALPRRHPVIAPKPSYPWPPRSSSSDPHKRKKANTPPPPDPETQSMWRPWH